MGAKQAKGQEPGGPSPQHSWRRTPSKERGDILTSSMSKSGDRSNRGGTPPPPYQRRIGMIQEMMMMAKQGKQDEATEMSKTLRQDSGMESTSSDDVSYRYASFRNSVDPITHDSIISSARYVHCPKTEGDSLGAMEKVCRQSTYHLSPHSQWRRQGSLKRKPQACLKAVSSAPLSSGASDSSGIPSTTRDMERSSAHSQRHASNLVSLESGFTELTDEAFLQLLPTSAASPHSETSASNGNRSTRAISKELTDASKDPNSFPSVTWIDLGNNVDIFSSPQAFSVSSRKRCPKQGNSPTISEFGESQASDPPERPRGLGEEEETDDTNSTESMGELRSEVEEEMDGETEIEEMMEELSDFDREIQGKEDEEESMWTSGEQRRATVRSRRARQEEEEEEKAKEKEGQRREMRPGRRAVMAEDDDDTQSRSSRSSCSSQSQHSFAAVEPMRVEEEDLTDQSEHFT